MTVDFRKAENYTYAELKTAYYTNGKTGRYRLDEFAQIICRKGKESGELDIDLTRRLITHFKEENDKDLCRHPDDYLNPVTLIESLNLNEYFDESEQAIPPKVNSLTELINPKIRQYERRFNCNQYAIKSLLSFHKRNDGVENLGKLIKKKYSAYRNRENLFKAAAGIWWVVGFATAACIIATIVLEMKFGANYQTPKTSMTSFVPKFAAISLGSLAGANALCIGLFVSSCLGRNKKEDKLSKKFTYLYWNSTNERREAILNQYQTFMTKEQIKLFQVNKEHP